MSSSGTSDLTVGTGTPLNVVVASTPVGPLGSGIGGGVELTLHSLVYGLGALGHRVEVVAPAGSLLVGHRLHQIAGSLQVSTQTAARDAPAEIRPGSVLPAMWSQIGDLVRDPEHRVDAVVNMAYDWLPLYLTDFFDVPVLHLVSMGSLNDTMDEAIGHVASRTPGRLAAHSRAQAATFPEPGVFRIVGNGIVIDRYEFRPVADEPVYLGFVGRISPEKGLEDVAALSQRSGLAVRVWGVLQDPAYWASITERHPDARLEYRGFLPTDELQADIGGCSAIVMTPKWVEAFGNVAVEAMATGVPVIAYDRGGPSEIVLDGVNGWLVPPDDIAGLVAAVGRIDLIDRAACRAHAVQHHSTEAFAARIEAWMRATLPVPAEGRIIARSPGTPTSRSK